jgi:hypothetical protein
MPKGPFHPIGDLLTSVRKIGRFTNSFRFFLDLSLVASVGGMGLAEKLVPQCADRQKNGEVKMFLGNRPALLGSPDAPGSGPVTGAAKPTEAATPKTAESLAVLDPVIGPVPTDPSRIKTLPPSVVKDIEQKNIARRLAGLSPITIKVRRCIACGSPFESAGNRTCGCSSRTAGTIAGREII